MDFEVFVLIPSFYLPVLVETWDLNLIKLSWIVYCLLLEQSEIPSFMTDANSREPSDKAQNAQLLYKHCGYYEASFDIMKQILF